MKGSDNIRDIKLIGAHTKNGLKLRKIMERVIEENEVNLPLTISEDLDNKLKHKYNIKEIMDDTGCFPIKKWLNDFCNLMIERKLNKKVNIDCNMRFGSVNEEEYRLMKKAGFRFLLFGLESASQITLDKLKKGNKAEEILTSCKAASDAGLSPHITVMLGYPWET